MSSKMAVSNLSIANGLLAAFFLVFAPNAFGDGIPANVLQKDYAGNNKCYAFFTSNKTYMQAQGVCKGYQGILAVIKSSYLNDFLAKALPNSEKAWIGLNDIEEEMKYVWSDGTDFNQSEFQGFASGYGPFDSSLFRQGIHDCVALQPDATWTDSFCGFSPFAVLYTGNFICEFSSQNTNCAGRMS